MEERAKGTSWGSDKEERRDQSPMRVENGRGSVFQRSTRSYVIGYRQYIRYVPDRVGWAYGRGPELCTVDTPLPLHCRCEPLGFSRRARTTLTTSNIPDETGLAG